MDIIVVVFALFIVFLSFPFGAMLAAKFEKKFYYPKHAQEKFIHFFLAAGLSVSTITLVLIIPGAFLFIRVPIPLAIAFSYISSVAAGMAGLWHATRKEKPAKFLRLLWVSMVSMLIFYGFIAAVAGSIAAVAGLLSLYM